jgi:RHS repeat-associated protein
VRKLFVGFMSLSLGLTALRAEAECVSMTTSDVSQATAAGWQVQSTPCMASTDPPAALPSPPAPIIFGSKMRPTGTSPNLRVGVAGGDPVLGDGEFYEQRTDVSLPGFGSHYEFTRTYRSGVNAKSGRLGYGWDHNYNQHIVGILESQTLNFDPSTSFIVPYAHNSVTPAGLYEDGGFDYQDGALNLIHFHYVRTDSHYNYAAPRGVPLVAIWYGYGYGYSITNEITGEHFDFARNGVLIGITDLASNTISIGWTEGADFDGTNALVHTVDDGIRKVWYVYQVSASNDTQLQCISTTEKCDSGTLASFVYDPTTGDMKTVYHGTNTTGESYAYAGKPFNPTAWPADCLASASGSLYASCNSLCGKTDLSNIEVTGAYADYTDLVANACADKLCKLYQQNPYILCVSKPYDIKHPDQACMEWNNVLPDCMTGCLQRYQCNGLFPSMPDPTQPYPYISFGAAGDLTHNITDVYDESGQLVVHNEYGTVPWNVSYDHVISQQLGPGQPAAANETNVMTFQYHDLNIETQGGTYAPVGYYNGPYSIADSDHVLPIWNFNALNICPISAQGTNEANTPIGYKIYGPAVIDTTVRPATAVVITDVHGNTHTQYYDQEFNVLRQVDRDPSGASSQTAEYNYDVVNGTLIGQFETTGIRDCFVVDAFGQQYQTTKIPAGNYAGSQSPFVTVYGYDDNRQLTDIYDDVSGFISHKHYGRDSHERITELDEDIDSQSARHTYYSYDEDPSPATDTGAASVRETPATVYHGSRTAPTSIDTYRTLDPSMGGVQQITLNSGGDLPKVTQFTYEPTMGRMTDVVDSSGISYHYDYEVNTGRVTQIKHQLDANSPWVAVQINQHDSNGWQLDTLFEPGRATGVSYSGQYPYELDRVSGHSNDVQSTCFHYAADGVLEDVLLPETNRIHYEYDFAGRPTSTTKGNDPAGTSWVDSRCANAKTTPLGGDNTGMQVLSGTQYASSGFPAATYAGDKWRSIVTDGFGRVIQTASLEDSSVVNVAVKQFGYDSRGRLVWTADLATGSGLPSTGYAEPVAGQTPGLLDKTNYNYDYLGRTTGVYKYVLETGELYTTTWSYDDANLSVTMTDRGHATQTVYDGLGRLRYAILPDGSQITAIQYGQGYAVFTQDTNQGQQTRTYQTDSRGNLIGILDGYNNSSSVVLYSAHYDDHGNLTNVQRAGEGVEIRGYDPFDRLKQVQKDLQNGSFSFQYWDWDRNDRMATYTDGDLHVWQTTPTGYDSPFSIVDPVGRTTQYYYQQYPNHPAGVIEGNGRTTCYRYDADLRLRYVYNSGKDCFRGSDGNILKPYTPMLDSAMYSYTDRGEVAEVDASADASRPSAATVFRSYDSLGRKVLESAYGGDDSLAKYDVATSYPDMGRSISTQVSEVTITADFCRNGICNSPSVWMVAFARHYADGLGRLSGVDLNGQPIATYTNGLGIGGPTSVSYPNIATTAQFSYDSRLRRIGTNVTFAPSGQTPNTIASLQDALGADSVPRMRQRQFGAGPVLTDVYQVDADRRMIAENDQVQQNISMLPSGGVTNANVESLMATPGNNWMQYGLDNEGNWASAMTTHGTTQMKMDAMGRLSALSIPGWSQPVQMDTIDNIQGFDNVSVPQFSFEPFSGLMYSAAINNTTYQYVYDALGRRAAEILPDGSMQVFLWDGQQIVAHGDPNSLTVDVPGDDVDSHIASVEEGGVGKARYYHQGPDQSILAVSDENGLVEGYSYSTFGSSTAAIGETVFNNRFLFQGQLFDPLTQTYSMRARQYWPGLGRFLSPDPMSFLAGPSVYSFTGSRPLIARDPSGMDSWDWGSGYTDLGGVLAGIIGALIGAAEGHSSGDPSYAHSPGQDPPRYHHNGFKSVPVPAPNVSGIIVDSPREEYKALTIRAAPISIPHHLCGSTQGGEALYCDDPNPYASWNNDGITMPERVWSTPGEHAWYEAKKAIHVIGLLTMVASLPTALARLGGAAAAIAFADAGVAAEASQGIRVTQKGLDIATSHLSNPAFIPTPENAAMLSRLQSSVGTSVTGADANFYLHEISESTMMGRGMLYDAAHEAALAKYGVSPFSLYHPDVIQALPGSFNSAWRAYWELP